MTRPERLSVMIGALYGIAIGFFVTALHATRPRHPCPQIGQPQ